MEVFSLVILAALIGKAMTVIKAIGKDWNMVATQVGVWVVGWVVAVGAAHTSWASTIVIQNIALSAMNPVDLFFLGAALGSGISQVRDAIKARDNTDSAAEPPLLLGIHRRRRVLHAENNKAVA